MNDRLARTVELLETKGIPHRVIDLGGPAVRARDVAAQRDLDIDVNAIVKTILFKRKSDGSIFGVAVPGKDRISYKKLRKLVDGNVSPLHPDEMRSHGWEPGECCPLSIPWPLYLDPAVLEKDVINTGSGDLHYGLEFPSKAIQNIHNQATIADVREEVK